MRTIFALLLLSSVALAEPPKAVISGPTEAMPGDFVDLDASASVGDFFHWRVEPPQFADGRKTFRFPKGPSGAPAAQKSKECGIASRPGKYTITLTVSNKEGIADTTWTVTVFDGPPQTPPAQPPTTPPAQPPATPPATPQPSGLSDWVFQQATALVTPEARAVSAAKLAESYRKYSAIGASAAKSPAEFAKGQAMLNQATLLVTGGTAAWDKFLRALAEKLAGMNMTIPQQQAAWISIAEGLERSR